MDPLTAAVLAAITAYVTRTSGEILDAAGHTAFEKAKEMFGRLKSKWSGNEAASGDLERFAADPKLYGTVVGTRLERQLADDPELREEFERLVQEMGPQIAIVQRMAEGSGVVGVEAEAVRKGRVSVDQDIERGDDIVGGKFGTIG